MSKVQLIVARDFKPYTGGIAEYTHQIARHLHLADENVMVLAPKMRGHEEFDSLCSYKVRRDKAGLIQSSPPDGLRLSYRKYKAIQQATLEHHTDLIISNALISEAHICWLVAKILGIPYCLFTYGLELREEYHLGRSLRGVTRPLRRKFERILALRGANLIFACSSYTKYLVEQFGVPPSKIVVLHPGLDPKELPRSTEKLDPVEIDGSELDLTDKKVILTVARLIERKGVDKVIEAFNDVKERIPNAVYVVVGEGPYRDTLQNLVQQFGLSDRVVFTGYLPEKEKNLYLNAADVFVMPNRELANGHVEGFGIVFLEANGFAKPVIGGKSGGVVDAVLDGITGLLVDPTDTSAVASALINLLENEDYAKRLGAQGRERVERELNWPTLIAKIREDLKALVE